MPVEQRSRNSRVDLRSRGLCLVPISFTEKLAFDKGNPSWF